MMGMLMVHTEMSINVSNSDPTLTSPSQFGYWTIYNDSVLTCTEFLDADEVVTPTFLGMSVVLQ